MVCPDAHIKSELTAWQIDEPLCEMLWGGANGMPDNQHFEHQDGWTWPDPEDEHSDPHGRAYNPSNSPAIDGMGQKILAIQRSLLNWRLSMSSNIRSTTWPRYV